MYIHIYFIVYVSYNTRVDRSTREQDAAMGRNALGFMILLRIYAPNVLCFCYEANNTQEGTPAQP